MPGRRRERRGAGMMGHSMSSTYRAGMQNLEVFMCELVWKFCVDIKIEYCLVIPLETLYSIVSNHQKSSRSSGCR